MQKRSYITGLLLALLVTASAWGQQEFAFEFESDSKKLAPQLEAIRVSGGELMGISAQGKTILKMSDEKLKAFKANQGVVGFEKFSGKEVSEMKNLLIMYKGDTKPSKKDLAAAGFEFVEDYKAGNFLVVKPLERLSADNINKLVALDFAYAEPDFEVQLPPIERLAAKQVSIDGATANTPNDPRFPEMWGLQNIQAEIGWNRITEAQDIIVAVIDTGVDYRHPDLKDNMWVNEKEKNGTAGVDDDGNGIIDDIFGADFFDDDGDPMDGHNHGTHCSGSIAAVGNNGVGVTGVAWRTKIMALRFLGPSGSTSDAIRCIDYAVANGAHILSNSWGGGGFSTALRDAIARAEAKGVLFVAAAGNSNRDTDSSPHFPSSYDVENIISVAAINSSNQRASFSNFGKNSVDIGAPGRDILSTLRNGQYGVFSGTSMATPHVSGALALVWQNEFSSPQQDATQMKTVRDLCFANVRIESDLQDLWGHGSLAQKGGVLDISFLDSKNPPPAEPGNGFAIAGTGSELFMIRTETGELWKLVGSKWQSVNRGPQATIAASKTAKK